MRVRQPIGNPYYAPEELAAALESAGVAPEQCDLSPPTRPGASTRPSPSDRPTRRGPWWTSALIAWVAPWSRGAVWSARRPVKPEAAGSNPVGTAEVG